MKIAHSLLIVLATIAFQHVSVEAAGPAQSARISAVTDAIRKNPADLQLRRLLVNELIKTGQCKSATLQMQALVGAGMRTAEDYALLGDCFRYSADFRKAMYCYKEALVQDSSSAHASSGLALNYMLSGQSQAAQETCSQALAQSTNAIARQELLQTAARIAEFNEQTKATKSTRVATVDGVRF